MSPELSRMRVIADEYCRLIEGLEHRPADWLERLNTLLPRLHAAVASLAGSRGDGRHYLEPNLDARFELYTRLRDLLGDRDSYWMEFDGAGEEQCKSGSLADDLTDIYCELKYGLTLLDAQPEDPNDAFEGWRNGYRVHWGQHLVDAERHLYSLQSRNKLRERRS